MALLQMNPSVALNMSSTAWVNNLINQYFPGGSYTPIPFTNAIGLESSSGAFLLGFATSGVVHYINNVPASTDAFNDIELHGNSNVSSYVFTISDFSITFGQLVAFAGSNPSPAGIAAFVSSLLQGQNVTIDGSNFSDVLVRPSSAATVTLDGIGGSDTFDGRGGPTTMIGHGGSDVFFVDNAGDVITESAPGGSVVNSSISYTLPANVTTLTLTGSANINGTGNSGNNVINGNAGNNVLTGGGGNDTINGGAGFDTAVYSGAFRQYHINGNPIGSTTIQGPDGTDSLTSIEKVAFIDGSLIFDPTANIARVERLYLATLNRLPDPKGLNDHTALLDSGTTLSQDAQGFVNSPEFQGIYGPSLTPSQFVELLYGNVLHRHSDPGGLAFYVNNLNNGITRGETVTDFSESPEFINNNAALFNEGLWNIDQHAASVERLYLGLLGRSADVSGLTYYVGLLNGGQQTLGQEATNFTVSPEFQHTYGALTDPTQFVTQLYQNVLGRAPDAGGLAFYVNNLNHGVSRGETTLGFTESPEYQVKTIGQIDHGIAAVDAHFP